MKTGRNAVDFVLQGIFCFVLFLGPEEMNVRGKDVSHFQAQRNCPHDPPCSCFRVCQLPSTPRMALESLIKDTTASVREEAGTPTVAGLTQVIKKITHFVQPLRF